MGGLTEKALKKKTLDILDLSEVDDSEASCRAYVGTVGIQKHLQLLPRIVGNDTKLCEAVLEAYKNKFKVSAVIDTLEPSSLELLTALTNRLEKGDDDDEETIRAMFKTSAGRLKASELFDLYNEAMKPKLRKLEEKRY